jgi:glycosyltransferase involved in cell wall biosynthesis
LTRQAVAALGVGQPDFLDDANAWLMRTMAKECSRRPAITAVHAFEDCSLRQFEEAKRLGKACIYDLPTCYYPLWERTFIRLQKRYSDWMAGSEYLNSSENYHRKRKEQELELADVILVASEFVKRSVLEFQPTKTVQVVPYGVDLEFWSPSLTRDHNEQVRYIYAGQISVRKGMPLLLEAWSKANLKGASLRLVGSWQLAHTKIRELPAGVSWFPPCTANELRNHFRSADVFVFPSHADGFGLVLLEAMASGLSVIASETSAAPEIVTKSTGVIFPEGNLDALVAYFRHFEQNPTLVTEMSGAARARALEYTWQSYRLNLANAVQKYC